MTPTQTANVMLFMYAFINLAEIFWSRSLQTKVLYNVICDAFVPLYSILLKYRYISDAFRFNNKLTVQNPQHDK
jgi:hypothetical protein